MNDKSVRLGLAAGLSAFINVAIVALLEVDAFVVGFWYTIAGFASVFLAGLLAEGAARLMNR